MTWTGLDWTGMKSDVVLCCPSFLIQRQYKMRYLRILLQLTCIILTPPHKLHNVIGVMKLVHDLDNGSHMWVRSVILHVYHKFYEEKAGQQNLTSFHSKTSLHHATPRLHSMSD